MEVPEERGKHQVHIIGVGIDRRGMDVEIRKPVPEVGREDHVGRRGSGIHGTRLC